MCLTSRAIDQNLRLCRKIRNKFNNMRQSNRMINNYSDLKTIRRLITFTVSNGSFYIEWVNIGNNRLKMYMSILKQNDWLKNEKKIVGENVEYLNCRNFGYREKKD